MKPAPLDPAHELMRVWQILLHEYPWGPISAKDEVTALVSLLLNKLVGDLQRVDEPGAQVVRGTMRQLAERLQTLADTPATQLDSVAQFLADEPRIGITRQ